MDSHITAETLELYALQRFAEPESAGTDEHLLVCEQCRGRLIGAERFIQAMREGFKRNGWETN